MKTLSWTTPASPHRHPAVIPPRLHATKTLASSTRPTQESRSARNHRPTGAKPISPAPGGRRKQALRTQNLKKGGCGQWDTATSLLLALPENNICAAERHIRIAMTGCANQNHRRSSGLGCPPGYRASRQPNSSLPPPCLPPFSEHQGKLRTRERYHAAAHTHRRTRFGIRIKLDSSSLRWTVDTPSRCIRTRTSDPPRGLSNPSPSHSGGESADRFVEPGATFPCPSVFPRGESFCFPSRGVDGSSPANTARTWICNALRLA